MTTPPLLVRLHQIPYRFFTTHSNGSIAIPSNGRRQACGDCSRRSAMELTSCWDPVLRYLFNERAPFGIICIWTYLTPPCPFSSGPQPVDATPEALSGRDRELVFSATQPSIRRASSARRHCTTIRLACPLSGSLDIWLTSHTHKVPVLILHRSLRKYQRLAPMSSQYC